MAIEQGFTAPTPADSSQPTEIISLEPKVRIRRGHTNQRFDDSTGKLDSKLRTFFSHRLDLDPPLEERALIGKLREEKRAYVYRRGLWDNNAKIIPGILGQPDRGVYGVSTRWAAKHWGALTSMITGHGNWILVKFNEPTENPPHTIPFKKEKK